MNNEINNKKSYLKWFLHNHKLKRPETAEILNLLIWEDSLLERVRFVEDVSQIPNALIISAEGSVTVSYLCRLNGIYYEEVGEILAELVNHPPEQLSVWLSYDKEKICSICHEEKWYNTTYEQETSGGNSGNSLIRALEEELNKVVQEKIESRNRLLKEIDWALDQGDKEKFFYLTYLFKQLG